jgi:cytosine deaminase
MKKIVTLFISIILVSSCFAQKNTTAGLTVDPSYFITHTRDELVKKLLDMPFGITNSDPNNVILKKIETYLVNFKTDNQYSDDKYAKAANLQALKSVMEGGYGIGSVLINEEGKIISAAHNTQIQKHRSDLHAEMTLLTNFENSRLAKKYVNVYVYKPGLTVFSSAEPCPMCFVRISITGADTKYCTPGPEDGMVSRVNFLPDYWKGLALQRKVDLGNCSPEMQKLAHLLFYSYLLDNRGPH